jgi:hypothetical protein
MDPDERFTQASQLGDLTMIHLWAENLLGRIDDPKHPVPVPDHTRELLARIASTPKLEDREFLGEVASIFEEDD